MAVPETEPDRRIPVAFGDAAQARPGDCVVAWRGGSARPHVSGCACCQPRAAIATTLARLYMGWVRGNEAPPARVLLVTEDPAAAAAAINADVLLRARFRLSDEAARASSA